jgi:PhnB protein
MPRVNKIPKGYHSVQPYLILKGCAEAIEFYKEAFSATERFRMKQPDGRIAHAEIQIGNSVIMMADENPEIAALGPEHYGGSPVSILIYTRDCDAMYASALAAGATSLREPTDQSYGDRMGGVKDPFGYSWFLSTHIKDVPLEEMIAGV